MLNEKQYRAIELLAVPGVVQKDVAAELGLGKNTLTTWRKNPEFQAELKQQTIRHARNGVTKVIAAMEREALSGNAAAAKLYLQATGYLDPREAVLVEAPNKAITTEELQQRLAKLRSPETATANAESLPVS